MSTAVAMAPSPAPHDRPSFSSDLAPTASAQHPSNSPAAQRALAPMATPIATAYRSGCGSPRGAIQAPKSSPPSASRSSGPPRIIVKKEPNSPDLPNTRHRPRKLDLSNKGAHPGSNTPGTARPMTARENLGIQEVGLACLSPGFVTQDPVMKEQLQRSMSVRDQQRMIIEQRMQQQSAKGDGPDTGKDPVSQFAAKTPGLSRRNKAQLSILPPSAEQFANERVIQSAPLGHSFTGRQHPAPLTRHIANQPNTLSNTSHIHHVPANQTANRLPPISDVFGQVSGHPDNAPSSNSLYPQNSARPAASPGHPPQQMQHPPTSARPREYKSAEEAQHELAGGRADLLPKIVHYGGAHQPPTPPSPAPGNRAADPSRSASRRRTRAEYEDGSPPLGHGPAPQRRGPFGAGRDSPESQRQKREEFLRLCERAWDLFHS